MSQSENNKKLVKEAFDGLARGDAAAFSDLQAEDFTWIIEGQSRFSRAFKGKEAVHRELVRPLFANFATEYRNHAQEIIAEGDRIVVLARGQVKTVRGEDYNNSYCFVIRMRDGKMVELVEYMDTALAESRLELGSSV
jgi:ketosteroid isomerase-like protein